MHLVGFIIRIYQDTRSAELQNRSNTLVALIFVNWVLCDKNSPLSYSTDRYVGCHQFVTHFDIQNRGLSIYSLT